MPTDLADYDPINPPPDRDNHWLYNYLVSRGYAAVEWQGQIYATPAPRPQTWGGKTLDTFLRLFIDVSED
jgi:hypothetical protein